MKLWIITVSIVAGCAAGAWGLRRLAPEGYTTRQRLALLGRGLAVGVIVYFILMALALVYLMITTN
jgi:hypothetical protein